MFTVILLLLDLSAAFDTVDHSVLLSRLSDRFSCQWYVPQGWVLGPLLYVLYTTPFADIIKSHNLQYHFYADDIHNYTTPLRPTVMLMLACPGQGLNTELQISTDG